jgi:hypothetical protein
MAATKAPPTFSLPIRVSLFLLSIATLVFEINLTRLFSVAQFYHFSFMIVSLALLGFGASGTFLAIFPGLGRQHPSRTVGLLAIGTSLSILGSYLLINWLPFDSFRIAWDSRQIGIFALHYMSLALPFFFSGTAVGLLLGSFSKSAGTVYAVNLIGSSLGCLGALAAPPFFGGEGTVVLSSGLAVLAGLIPVLDPTAGYAKYKGIVLLAGSVLVFNIYALGSQIINGSPLPPFELKISPYKSLSYALQFPGAEVLSQRWNAFSRLDVVSSPGIRSIPGVSFRYLNPPPPEIGLLVDGDNLSPMVLQGADLEFTSYLLAALAFELRPDASVLLLEPGGGFDILTGLKGGANRVTAVEPNPLIVEAAAKIYQQENVETVLETGRNYLSQGHEKYDLVIFSLTNTYHPVRSGAYSLAEDYRYTLEAYQDALYRLEDNGILVIRRWLQIPPSEWLRSFTLAVNTLEHNKLDPTERIVAIRSFNLGLLLIKKIPFSDDELDNVRAFAADRAFDLVYLSNLQMEEINRFSILEEPLYYQAFNEYLSTPSRQDWLDEYPYDISPPTDNHPFFGHYFKWSQASQIIAELGKSWQPFGGAGYFVLLILLSLAMGMAVVIILLPLSFIQKSTPLPKETLACLTYFGLIGLAFLLVEIPLIQHFILYLGHPAYAFTTALFSILLFSGIGSLYAHRFSHQLSMVMLVVVASITPWLLPMLFDFTLGYPFVTRVLITIFSLAPLGFLMGIPFPSGIHKLQTSAPNLIPWAWGVNGAFSVLSSILAALIALSFGFSWSLIAGSLCYAGALIFVPHLMGRKYSRHYLE